MSISSEITSIGENLKKDYQSIANLGADLTNVDKNIENIAELLDNVYDVLPKTEFQEGTEVNLGKTIKGKLDYENGVVGIGQAKQETTNGYQLIDINANSFNTQTQKGVTITNNGDGSITLNGTASEAISLNISNETSIEVGNYHGSMNVVGGSVTVQNLVVIVYGYDTTAHQIGSFNSNNLGTNFSIETAYTKCYLYIWCASGTSFNNYHIKPMVEKGSTAHEWEQYTGGQSAPNPSYPFPIQCVTGNQSIVVSGKNEFDESTLFTEKTLNGITAKFENGKLNITGTATTGTNIYWPYNLDNSMLGKTLTLSYSGDFSNINNVGFKKGGTDKVIINSNTPNRTFEVTQTLINDVNQFSIWITSGSVVNASINIQLEQGSTATPYKPHITPKSYQLSLGDIQLNAIGNYKDELIYDVDEDKVYKNEKIGKYELPQITEAIRTGTVLDTPNTYYTIIRELQNIIDIAPVTQISYNWYCNKLHRANGIVSDYGAYIVTGSGNTNMVIIVNSNDTLESLNQKLNNNVFYYQEATPTLTEITDTTLINQVKALYNAQSINGTTIITSNGDLPLIIKCRALKGE